MADGHSGFRRQALDLGFDLVEFGDALQPGRGDGGGAVAGDFKVFAAGMDPTIGKLSGRTRPVGLNQTVMPSIAIHLQNVGEAL